MQEPLLPPTEEGDVPENPYLVEQRQPDTTPSWEQTPQPRRMNRAGSQMKESGMWFLRAGGGVLVVGILASFGLVRGRDRYYTTGYNPVSIVWPPNPALLAWSCLFGGTVLLIGVTLLVVGRIRK